MRMLRAVDVEPGVMVYTKKGYFVVFGGVAYGRLQLIERWSEG